MNRNEIETQMAETISKEVGAEVEVTLTGTQKVTISGTVAAARKAATWMQIAGLMFLDSFAEYVEDGCDEGYAYMTSVI